MKSASVKEVREKDATKLIEKAVKGMLQHNTLGAQQFTKLKVYCGPEHPHAAQKPIVLEKEAKLWLNLKKLWLPAAENVRLLL